MAYSGSGKQDGGCKEDGIEVVVVNSCNLATESNKSLIHLDNSLKKSVAL